MLAMLILFAVPAMPAISKAAYLNPSQMIVKAEAIAIIDISSVEKANVKGAHFSYGSVATASVSKLLKGRLGKSIKLYGDENFECAQVKLKPGRYLAFLRMDGRYLVGNNWQWSLRPINDSKVKWFKRAFSPEIEVPLADVEKQIQVTLAIAH